MKAKMSVTVDRKIVDWIDEQVRTQRFRNRSHAVEVALMKYLQTEKKP
jgi:Arc/MetJ-type ribon-helix-helix transcriptional regulator